MTPVELSGGVRFPEIGDRPYFLNLSPFAFYWFTLERRPAAEVTAAKEVPLIGAKKWEEVFADRNREALANAILSYIRTRRWFGGKARTVSHLSLSELVPLPKRSAFLAMIDVEYTEGESQTYLLPLGQMQARRAE